MKSTAIVSQRPALSEVVASAPDAEFANDIAILDVSVVDGYPSDGWGSYDHSTRTITLLCGLGKVQRRSVLARMLGHAYYGHDGMGPQEEQEAQAWAARRLISGARVAATLKAVNWLGLLARELEVMPSDMAAFLASLTCEEQLGIRDAIAMEPRGY